MIYGMSTLLSHTDIIYEDDTIVTAGQVFINCTFRRCILVVTDAEFLFHTSAFDSCVWQLHLTLHDVDKVRRLQQMLPLIEGGLPNAPDPLKK